MEIQIIRRKMLSMKRRRETKWTWNITHHNEERLSLYKLSKVGFVFKTFNFWKELLILARITDL
jgi:ABC-type lipoprotein export system ATPase subunit